VTALITGLLSIVVDARGDVAIVKVERELLHRALPDPCGCNRCRSFDTLHDYLATLRRLGKMKGATEPPTNGLWPKRASTEPHCALVLDLGLPRSPREIFTVRNLRHQAGRKAKPLSSPPSLSYLEGVVEDSQKSLIEMHLLVAAGCDLAA
jgi:hypothetical protein